jgi:hypothetical protein
MNRAQDLEGGPVHIGPALDAVMRRIRGSVLADSGASLVDNPPPAEPTPRPAESTPHIWVVRNPHPAKRGTL